MGCSISKSGKLGHLRPNDIHRKGNAKISENFMSDDSKRDTGNQEGEASFNGNSLKAPPKKLDPRLPLNERQLFGIKRSWKAIGRNMVTTGVNMFIRLFETNMDLRYQFKEFKDLTNVADLRKSEGFMEHAILVMCTIDEAINNLDDVPYVIEMLRKTGHSHKRFPGFKSDYFYEIEAPFLLAVRETLGDRFSFNIEVAYKRVIYFILDTLVQGFKS